MDYYLRLGRYAFEKSVLEGIEGNYGLVIPAHILSFYHNSITALLRTTKKHYFIDPMTYVFGTDPTVMKKADQEEYGNGSWEYKRSYKKLLEHYQGDLASSISAGALEPGFFREDKNLRTFVEQTLSLQKDFARKPSLIAKYEALIGEAEKEQERAPDFLLTPYFYFRDPSDEWYATCKRMLECARNVEAESEIYAALCFEKKLLQEEALLDQVISDFSGFDGYVALVSGFDEERESLDDLRRLRRFFQNLSGAYKKPVINLYGSCFSATLASAGLRGFSSGLCIHDHKDVAIPYVTGRAIVRYYVPTLHVKLAESETKTFFAEYDFVSDCSCDFCREVERILSPARGTEARTRVVDALFAQRGWILKGTLTHFLSNRLKEVMLLEGQDPSALLRELARDKNTCIQRRYTDLHSIDHLERWLQAHQE